MRPLTFTETTLMCDRHKAGSITTARRAKAARPTRMEQMAALGRAMSDAARVFDHAVLMYSPREWADDGTVHADFHGLADAVRRAAVLCRAVTDTLAPHFPPRVGQVTPDTDGNVLRHTAEQLDRLDHALRSHEGMLDEQEKEYQAEELYPHVLADRSARNPAVCPLCGSARELTDGEDLDGSAMRMWACWTCNGDVKKAKRVLRRKRVGPDAKPAAAIHHALSRS